METIPEWMKAMPGIWWIIPVVLATFGGFVASLIFQWVNRDTAKLARDQRQEITQNHKEQLSSIKDLYDAQTNKLTSERDEYKQRLHDEKDAHQATRMQVHDLQGRPDLTKLSTTLDALNMSLTDTSKEHRLFMTQLCDGMGKLLEAAGISK